MNQLPKTCFVWPWRGARNEKIAFLDALKARKFTLSYLIVIIGIIAAFGYASTRDCDSTWQLKMYCNYSFWAKNLFEEPLLFFRNLFTMPFIHNSIDHIGFVIVIGLNLVVQAYEVKCGWIKTMITFFMGYLIMCTFYGFFFNFGVNFWQESEFFQDAFTRSWIGGSLSLYFLFGPLIFYCKKPWIHLSVPIAIELFNAFVLNISPQITFVHLTSTIGGIGYKLFFDQITARTNIAWIKTIAP